MKRYSLRKYASNNSFASILVETDLQIGHTIIYGGDWLKVDQIIHYLNNDGSEEYSTIAIVMTTRNIY